MGGERIEGQFGGVAEGGATVAAAPGSEGKGMDRGMNINQWEGFGK